MLGTVGGLAPTHLGRFAIPGPQALRKRLAARTWRRGKVELEEVEEAGEEVEEGLLDEVEGGAEGRPRWHPGQGHRSRASVGTSISWPEGGTGERCGSPPFPRA